MNEEINFHRTVEWMNNNQTLQYDDWRFSVYEAVWWDTSTPYQVLVENPILEDGVYFWQSFRTEQWAKCAVECFILENLK